MDQGLGRTQVARPGGVLVGGDGGGRVDEEELYGSTRHEQLEGPLAVPARVTGRQCCAQL